VSTRFQLIDFGQRIGQRFVEVVKSGPQFHIYTEIALHTEEDFRISGICKNNLLHQMFFWTVYVYNFWPSEVPWCVDICLTEEWLWYSDNWNRYTVQQTSSEGTFDRCFPAAKTLYSCKCMLANCGANTRRVVWSACALHSIMPTELFITYPEMQVFAHTKLANLYRFLQRCASSSNFFIRSLQMSDAFYKSSFFLSYLTLMYDGDHLVYNCW